MQAGILGLHVAEALTEHEVLAGEHGLRTAIIRVHTLPAAWQSASVEDYLNPVVVGVREDSLVEAHSLLLVSGEEIHLYSSNAVGVQPSHLCLAANRVAHTMSGALRRVVPSAVAVIPDPGIHAPLLTIIEELFHALTADVLKPSAIDKTSFPAERCGEVDKCHLVFVVYACILPDYPRPSVAGAFVMD